MYIKHKTCDIRIWKKHIFLDIPSTNIYTLVPLLYQCAETRNVEVFLLLSQPLRFNLFVISEIFVTFLDQVVNSFTRQTLPIVNRKYLFMNILCIKSSCPQKKTHNRTLFFGSMLLKHGRHFDYYNQLLSMRMLVFYLECNEAGICCYGLIHIENPLRPLQLFYFNLWHIYWLFLLRITLRFKWKGVCVPSLNALYRKPQNKFLSNLFTWSLQHFSIRMISLKFACK
jgi:hypothetical protein